VVKGVVTLTGTVDSFAQKLAAERAVRYVAGVRALAEDLKVKLPSASRRTDAEIAEAVVNALKWNVSVPESRIKVRVEDGWVTLEGQVDWKFQLTAAEECVRPLVGVKGVSNLITVRLQASAFNVKEKIVDALKRSAAVDSGRISVDAKDGEVTLKGTVRSWAERFDAEDAAWTAPGVTMVNDQIAVVG